MQNVRQCDFRPASLWAVIIRERIQTPKMIEESMVHGIDIQDLVVVV